MKMVIQRVVSASVMIENEVFSEIGNGLLVLLGVETADGSEDVEWLIQKIS